MRYLSDLRLPSRLSSTISWMFCAAVLSVSMLGQGPSDPTASIVSALKLPNQRVLRSMDMLDRIAPPPIPLEQILEGQKTEPASPFKFHGNKKYDTSKIGERGIGKGVNFYSLDKETAMGKELAQEFEMGAKLLKDPVVNEYVNRLGQNLVRNSDAKVPFTIKVIDNDEVNAFALPGGFFYVNTGLIEAADSEAELAGVMAHEIAHVAARHATKNMTKGQIWNLASIPLVFVGGPVGYAIQEVAGLAVPMSFLKFSRDAEREADLLGMEYQYASGYDPGSFVTFFERLKAQEKKKANFISKAFSTHPMTDDRVKRAQKEMSDMLPPRPQYVIDTSEFEEVKARLVGILNGRRMSHDNSNRPILRRTESGRPDITSGDGKPHDDDDRPTLKRPNDH